jgi:hypothetical protein
MAATLTVRPRRNGPRPAGVPVALCWLVFGVGLSLRLPAGERVPVIGFAVALGVLTATALVVSAKRSMIAVVDDEMRFRGLFRTRAVARVGDGAASWAWFFFGG